MMLSRIRSRMLGLKWSAAVSDSTALITARPSSRPWQRIGDDFSGFFMMRLAGPRFVRAAAAAKRDSVDGTGMEENGKQSLPPPTRQPKPPYPSSCHFSNWVKLVLGSVFSMLLAFGKPKWASLLKIGGKAEVVMHEIEQAAEVVEKVATVVEKASEEVVDNLPNDNRMKEAASVVEHISKEAAKDAHITQEIIHKIDDVKQDMEDVGEIVEPIIENIVHRDKPKLTVDG